MAFGLVWSQKKKHQLRYPPRRVRNSLTKPNRKYLDNISGPQNRINLSIPASKPCLLVSLKRELALKAQWDWTIISLVQFSVCTQYLFLYLYFVLSLFYFALVSKQFTSIPYRIEVYTLRVYIPSHKTIMVESERFNLT